MLLLFTRGLLEMSSRWLSKVHETVKKQEESNMIAYIDILLANDDTKIADGNFAIADVLFNSCYSEDFHE